MTRFEVICYKGSALKIIGEFTLTQVAIFNYIAPCSPYINHCFGGTYYLHLQGRKSDEHEIIFLAGASRGVGSHTDYREVYLRRWQLS
jgi:hypothetical protein